MVYRVLVLIAWILFGLVGVLFVVSLAYSLASPAARSGFSDITGSVRGIAESVSSAASQATEAIDAGWEAVAGSVSGNGLSVGAQESAEAAGGTAGTAAAAGQGAAEVAGQAAGTTGAAGQGAAAGTTGAAGQGSSASSSAAATPAAGFADAAQGQAFLAWKGAVADPVGHVFGGTGVTEALLEGVAGGSSSARGILTSLDDAALSAVSTSASNYAATVAATAVPSALPAEARAQMWQAGSAAQSFAASVQTLVAALRDVRSGSISALGDLLSAADSCIQASREMDACVAAAEDALRG